MLAIDPSAESEVALPAASVLSKETSAELGVALSLSSVLTVASAEAEAGDASPTKVLSKLGMLKPSVFMADSVLL